MQWDIRTYWSFRDDLEVIDGIIMKGMCVITPEIIKVWVLDQLYINHMVIEKLKHLACESIYWDNINDDTENFMKNGTTCLMF